MTARKLRATFLVLLFFLVSPLCASVLVRGDATDATTFTFSIGTHLFDDLNGLFYAGANTNAGKNFSLAVARSGSSPFPFQPLAPERITHNGVIDSTNPLYNKKISHLTLIENAGLGVVLADEPSSLYALASFLVFNGTSQQYVPDPALAKLYSVTAINDAEGNITAGIVGLAASSQNFFAAVKKSGGTFGEVGGGIALLTLALDKLNAVNGEAGGNLALPLDPTTPALKIGSNLASITANVVDMHYDSYLNRLFIALQVTAGGGASDGARAVVVARVDSGLKFAFLAPDVAVAGTDKIIGATGAGVQVSIFKVRTLHTSSGLSYLIVEGGNGTDVGNTVYALPLVDKTPVDLTGDATQGTLAVWNDTPVDKFFTNYPYTFKSRGLTTPATTAADMLTSSSVQARVGAGPLPLAGTQKITDIFARHDAVYVSIGDAFDGTATPGVFYSQALLDQLGRIKAWTPWQRAAGTDEKIFGIGLDRRLGNMWLMPGDSSTTLTTVRQTVWSNAAGDGLLGGFPNGETVGLVYQLSMGLSPDQGGIQNLLNFSQTTPGFGNAPAMPNNQLSFVAGVALNKVILAETGRNALASIFRANIGDFSTSTQAFGDGTLNDFVSTTATKIISISGGIINELGPLTTAEVSRTPLSGSTNNGYLFVGGTFGVAVLSKANGTGWDTSSPNGGLHAGFVGFTSDMSFKKLGGYSNVRKLVCDGTYLYVLTNTVLDRIRLDSIAGGSLVSVNLATLSQLALPSYASFSDVVISQKLGLLATSGGLFRVANGFDVTSAALASGGLGWTKVTLQEGLASATRFLVQSPTGFDAGLATGGTLYVLGGVVPFNQARVYRFAVGDVSSSAIDDNTVQPLNDLFIKGVPSFFIEFGSYRNFIASEGTSLFNTVSGTKISGPLIFNVETLMMGNRYTAKNDNKFVGTIPFSATLGIRQIMRNSASGAWLAAGGYGLYVNE